MFGFLGKSNEYLSDNIDLRFMIDDRTVGTSSSGLLTVLAFDPPDLETAARSELVVIADQLTALFAQLGTGWTSMVDMVRREDRSYLPPSDFGGNRAAKRVDDARRAQFEAAARPVFSNRFCVSLHWQPQNRDAILQLLNDRDAADFATVKRAFDDQIDVFLRGLGYLCPEVRILEGDELARYLAGCIDYRDMPCQLPDAYLNAQLAACDWHTGTELIIDGLTVKSVEVHAFGAVSPQTLEALHELPFELRWTTTQHHLDPEDQYRALEATKNKWTPKKYNLFGWGAVIATKSRTQSSERQDIVALVDELTDLQSELQEERDGLAITTMTVRTWHEDPGQAEDQAQVIAGQLNAVGMRARTATLNAVMGALADIPGNCSRNLVNKRRPYIRIATAVRCAPLTGVSDGDRWDRHLDAPALFVAKSRRHTQVFFSLHAPGTDVGHLAVTGRTGSGKSALLSTTALQYLRYPDSTVTIFDKRRSAMVPTLCAGGVHIELGGGGIGVQPLRLIDDPAGMAWAHTWIANALEHRQVKASARIDAAIRDGLQALKTLHPDERTISALHSSVGDDEVREALMHYTRRGPLGELFDGVVEGYGTSRMLTIETDHIMHLDEAPLALAACFRAIERERLTGGHPKLILIDEAWEPLAHPLFRNRIEDLARTLRKLNGQLCLFTQSPRDLERDHTAVIMQQMSNVIFTADSSALHPGNARIYHDIGLTDEQIETVASLRPKGEYLLKTPHYTRVADLTLEGDALRICGASRDADIARARALLTDGVTPGEEFLERWLNAS